MTITAHSGAFGTPDNSLEYVKKVLEEHCEIFEIDVTFRPDGTPVVIHSGALLTASTPLSVSTLRN